jgi:two-component sensor histidine kinase
VFSPDFSRGATTSLSEAPRSSHDDLQKEANHRIANNLSSIAGLVRLHAAETSARMDRIYTGAEVRGLLDEIGSRIETVGRLHRLLSEVPAGISVDLGAYIAETATALVSTLSDESRVRLSSRGLEHCFLDPDQAAPVALIVSELITNAIKHAHPAEAPGRIVVRCGTNMAGSVYVEVEDDGVGLPENFDPWRNGGLGFEIVRGLARQLGAKLLFDADGIGLRVRLMVPKVAMEPA